MSSIPALLGTPREICHKDVTYKCGILTKGIRLQFERKLAHRALERINQLLKDRFINKKQYQEELREHGRREDKGEFSLLSSNGLAVLNTAWGQETIMPLLMADTPPPILQELMETRDEEMMLLLKRALDDAFPQAAAKVKEQEEAKKKEEEGESETLP